MIEATLYTDAGCPWAYSANPALRVLEWRFRDQLSWRLVMIGLREEASEAAVRAYDPERALSRWRFFEERYGMPFGLEAKARPSGTGPRLPRGRRRGACSIPGASGACSARSSSRTSRARSTSTTPRAFAMRFAPCRESTPTRIAARIDDDEVVEEYERQRAEARSAAGTPAEAQGKTATSDGPVRFTAPSVVFRRATGRLVAGGWQPPPLLPTGSSRTSLTALERVSPPPGVARAAPRPLPGRA